MAELLALKVYPLHPLTLILLFHRLSDLTAKDKEKQLLEKAKNELESFIYDMGDKLTQELYEKCSTEKERESINKNLGDASDWLYDQDDDTKKEVYLSI